MQVSYRREVYLLLKIIEHLGVPSIVQLFNCFRLGAYPTLDCRMVLPRLRKHKLIVLSHSSGATYIEITPKGFLYINKFNVPGWDINTLPK